MLREPPLNPSAADAGDSGPLGNAVRFAAKLDAVIFTAVVGLIQRRGPNAIFRRVALVIVFSFDH
jgi:hypothetical protein